jgi:hypothetical protein
MNRIPEKENRITITKSSAMGYSPIPEPVSYDLLKFL